VDKTYKKKKVFIPACFNCAQTLLEWTVDEMDISGLTSGYGGSKPEMNIKITGTGTV
jgi:hypothetical protein